MAGEAAAVIPHVETGRSPTTLEPHLTRATNVFQHVWIVRGLSALVSLVVLAAYRKCTHCIYEIVALEVETASQTLLHHLH